MQHQQPSQQARQLVAALRPFSDEHIYSGQHQLPLSVEGQAKCYLIFDGQITVHRSLDDLLILTLKAPTLMGIGNISPSVTSLYLKTLNECTVGEIPVDTAHGIIEEQNMWQILSQHMMNVTARLFLSSQQLTAATSYELIRYQLQELMNESESYRISITAERYIRDKTNLSRSGILKILSDLRQGGFIETQAGILLKINKLPAKY